MDGGWTKGAVDVGIFSANGVVVTVVDSVVVDSVLVDSGWADETSDGEVEDSDPDVELEESISEVGNVLTSAGSTEPEVNDSGGTEPEFDPESTGATDVSPSAPESTDEVDDSELLSKLAKLVDSEKPPEVEDSNPFSLEVTDSVDDAGPGVTATDSVVLPIPVPPPETPTPPTEPDPLTPPKPDMKSKKMLLSKIFNKKDVNIFPYLTRLAIHWTCMRVLARPMKDGYKRKVIHQRWFPRRR